jgi:Flp pilus assembly protein CpaB
MRSLPRLIRCKTAILVVLSLLFSQLALANYLCPAEAPRQEMAVMAAGVPCEEMDHRQPVLCHQHMADAGQVVQAAQIFAPSLPAVIQVLVAHTVLPSDAVAMPRASTPEAQPPPDPIFLATLRLRV